MSATKTAAKQEVERVLAKLPDDASLEGVQYHLYVLQHVERGRRDIEEGRVLSSEEAERRRACRSIGYKSGLRRAPGQGPNAK